MEKEITLIYDESEYGWLGERIILEHAYPKFGFRGVSRKIEF
jgi:hypothetical protein